MNLEAAEKIAAAALYEGYMLYPYRPSSVKNQQRWNFGVLCPRSYCEQQQGSETWAMQTECLVKAQHGTKLAVKVRFLQIVARSVGKLRREIPQKCEVAESDFDLSDLDLVDRLEVGGRVYVPWKEAIERNYTSASLDLASLQFPFSVNLTFPAGKEVEPLQDEQFRTVGMILRNWEELTVSIEANAERCHSGVIKVALRVKNLTPFKSSEATIRDAALAFSLVSAHTVLGVEKGEFISLLEPPPELEDLALQCENIGTWPVLVGDDADTMLSSPIILYDHPQIAPESAGDLFDSTEIDEILSLRILTLTDDEKREMRQSDERARQILERTENMPAEQFMKLHGVLRGMTPAREEAQ